MAWTSVAKPTTPSWTNTNPQGREQYDQSDLTFDDSSIFYDGVNVNQWTDVATPSGPTWDSIVGTWAAYEFTWDEANWYKTNKPT